MDMGRRRNGSSQRMVLGTARKWTRREPVSPGQLFRSASDSFRSSVRSLDRAETPFSKTSLRELL